MGKQLYKPGEDNRPAGRYVEVGLRGGTVDHARHIAIDSGDRLPPTQAPNHRWKKQ